MHAATHGIRWAALVGLLFAIAGCPPPTDESAIDQKSDEKSEVKRRPVIQRFTPGLQTGDSAAGRQRQPNHPQPPVGQVGNPGVQNPIQNRQPNEPHATPTGRQSAPPTVNVPRRPTSGGYPGNPVATSTQIRLSTGVALPQSLPNGTQMSFQAEYQFIGGGPNPRKIYAWVIQGRDKTKRFFLTRPLKTRGKLPPLFTKEFRPGDKPFRSYLEEWDRPVGKSPPRNGRRVSNIIPLN